MWPPVLFCLLPSSFCLRFQVVRSSEPRYPISAFYFQRFGFPPVVRGRPPGFVGALWEPCRRIRDALYTHWGGLRVAISWLSTGLGVALPGPPSRFTFHVSRPPAPLAPPHPHPYITVIPDSLPPASSTPGGTYPAQPGQLLGFRIPFGSAVILKTAFQTTKYTNHTKKEPLALQ
jgi:hypothetical protein